MVVTRKFVAAACGVLLLAGCSQSADDQPSSQVQQPESTVVEQVSPTTAPVPALYEGVDPCSLATEEEVRNATGQQNSRPQRGFEPAADDSCIWGEDGLTVGFISYEYEHFVDRSESRLVSDGVGAQISVGSFNVNTCLAMIGFSEDRVINAFVVPTKEYRAGQGFDENDTVCERSIPLFKLMIERTGWEPLPWP